MMNDAKLALALLAGLAAGAALGILFAPESGIETRDKLSDSFTSFGESVKGTAADQVENLVGIFKENVMDKFSGITDRPVQDDWEHA